MGTTLGTFQQTLLNQQGDVAHEALLIVGEFANVAAALIKITSLGTANENSKAFLGGPSAAAQALQGSNIWRRPSQQATTAR